MAFHGAWQEESGLGVRGGPEPRSTDLLQTTSPAPGLGLPDPGPPLSFSHGLNILSFFLPGRTQQEHEPAEMG